MFSVELSCLPEILLRPGMQPVIQGNSALSLAKA